MKEKTDKNHTQKNRYSSDSCKSEMSDSFLSGSVASGTECTGLIPTPPVSDAELDAYEELYPFTPAQAVVPQKSSGKN